MVKVTLCLNALIKTKCQLLFLTVPYSYNYRTYVSATISGELCAHLADFLSKINAPLLIQESLRLISIEPRTEKESKDWEPPKQGGEGRRNGHLRRRQ